MALSAQFARIALLSSILCGNAYTCPPKDSNSFVIGVHDARLLGITTLDTYLPVFKTYFEANLPTLNKTITLRTITTDEVHQLPLHCPGYLDAAMTHPFSASCLSLERGATIVATEKARLVGLDGAYASSAFMGGLIIARADRSDINTVQDLRGKTVVASNLGLLSGMPQAVYARSKGVEIFLEAKAVITTELNRLAMYEVLKGTADVGFVASFSLPEIIQAGVVSSTEFKIIDPTPTPDLGTIVSGTVYSPGFAFVVFKEVSEDLRLGMADLLTDRLLSSDGSGWVHPWGSDYGRVWGLLSSVNMMDLVGQTCQWPTGDSRADGYTFAECPGLKRPIDEFYNGCDGIYTCPEPKIVSDFGPGEPMNATYSCVCNPCIEDTGFSAAVSKISIVPHKNQEDKEISQTFDSGPRVTATCANGTKVSGYEDLFCMRASIFADEITVTVVDNMHEFRSANSVTFPLVSNFVFRIKSSAESSGNLTVPVTNNGSGTYEYTFVGATTGIHFIQVIVNGEEVTDISPILLSIEPIVCPAGRRYNKRGMCVCPIGQHLVGGRCSLLPTVGLAILISFGVLILIAIILVVRDMLRYKSLATALVPIHDIYFLQPSQVVGIDSEGFPTYKGIYRGQEVAAKTFVTKALRAEMQRRRNHWRTSAEGGRKSLTQAQDQRTSFQLISPVFGSFTTSQSQSQRSTQLQQSQSNSNNLRAHLNASRREVAVADRNPSYQPRTAVTHDGQALAPGQPPRDLLSKGLAPSPLQGTGAASGGAGGAGWATVPGGAGGAGGKCRSSDPESDMGSNGTEFSSDDDSSQVIERISRTLFRMKNMNVSKSLLKRTLVLMNLRHRNVLTCYGVVSTSPPLLVLDLVENGTLSDILVNQTFAIDSEMLLHLGKGLASGLDYLHGCNLVHGGLSPHQVFADSDFTVKVAGLDSSPDVRKRKVPFAYVSPEVLNGEQPTAASDVYALGMIILQLITRSDPYGSVSSSGVESASEIKSGRLRPTIPETVVPELRKLLESCWLFDPAARPTARDVSQSLLAISRDNKHLIAARMGRPSQSDMGKTSEALIRSAFPPKMAQALLKGEKVTPEKYDNVTVLFSDVVQWTKMCSELTAEEAVDLLERLYSGFDLLVQRWGLFKIETIGDAYILASSLSVRQDDHTRRVAMFALEALAWAASVPVRAADPGGKKIAIRAGIHSGALVATVVSSKTPKLSIYGDTVNTCSRMESTAEPGTCQLSEVAARLLELQSPPGMFKFRDRGVSEIKGKGPMRSLQLVGLSDTYRASYPSLRRLPASLMPQILEKNPEMLLYPAGVPLPVSVDAIFVPDNEADKFQPDTPHQGSGAPNARSSAPVMC